MAIFLWSSGKQDQNLNNLNESVIDLKMKMNKIHEVFESVEVRKTFLMKPPNWLLSHLIKTDRLLAVIVSIDYNQMRNMLKINQLYHLCCSQTLMPLFRKEKVYCLYLKKIIIFITVLFISL